MLNRARITFYCCHMHLTPLMLVIETKTGNFSANPERVHPDNIAGAYKVLCGPKQSASFTREMFFFLSTMHLFMRDCALSGM